MLTIAQHTHEINQGIFMAILLSIAVPNIIILHTHKVLSFMQTDFEF